MLSSLMSGRDFLRGEESDSIMLLFNIKRLTLDMVHGRVRLWPNSLREKRPLPLQ